jgi:hypothetical protein
LGGICGACNDGNVCTDDSCDPGTGCRHVNNTAECDVGLFCAAGDRCNDGVCVGGTDDACPGRLCDELHRRCVDCFTNVDCDDGRFCNGVESCVNNGCRPGTYPCGGANPPRCDEEADECVDCVENAHCDDDDPCTDDLCTNRLCGHVNNTAPCDTGLFCTAGDRCKAGECFEGTDDACPGRLCDEPLRRCVDCFANADCDEGLVCSIGTGACHPPPNPGLVSVRCCTQESNLASIEDCVSGHGNLTQPSTCPPGAACVLGFGENTQLMAALCDLDAAVTATPDQASCSTWVYDAMPVAQECVAKSHLVATLFSVYDDDGDGDLDATDVALFEKVFPIVPNVVQSEAALTYMQCCLPEAVILSVGQCLSGPGVTAIPPACDGMATCIAGFSEAVEPGDYQYVLCGEPVVLPKPKDSYCLAWQAEDVATSFLCPAADIAGHAYFIVADTHGDVDVDLRDFAAIQREWEIGFR